MAGVRTEAYDGRDLSELRSAVGCFQGRERDMTNLYEEVSKMGSLSLWWDRKVPTSEKGFFNCISLKSKSDIQSMQVEIQQYKNFFENVKDVLDMVEKNSESTDSLIYDLYEDLDALERKARSGEELTSSSTVHHVHRDFVNKKRQLEGELKRIECIVTKKKLNTAVKGWAEAKREISQLKTRMDDVLASNEALTERVDRLVTMLERASLAEDPHDL